MYETNTAYGNLQIKYNISTGGIDSIRRTDDATGMNFVMSRVGFGVPKGRHAPSKIKIENGVMQLTYQYYNYLDCCVTRRLTDEGLVENYLFKNVGKEKLTFEKGELGVFATFSNDLDIAEVALNRRVVSTVFTGKSTAFIFNQRLNGDNKTLGLLVRKGEVVEYSKEDGYGMGQRGELALCFDSMALEPNESYEFEWQVTAVDSLEELLQIGNAIQGFCYPKTALGIVKKGEAFSLEFDKEIALSSSEKQEPPLCTLTMTIDTVGEVELAYRQEDRETVLTLYCCEDVSTIIQNAIEIFTLAPKDDNGFYLPYDKRNKKFLKNIRESTSNPARLLTLCYDEIVTKKGTRISEIDAAITKIRANLCGFASGKLTSIAVEPYLVSLYAELFEVYGKLKDKADYHAFALSLVSEVQCFASPHYLDFILRLIDDYGSDCLPLELKQGLIDNAEKYLKHGYYYPRLKPSYSDKAEAVRLLSLAIGEALEQGSRYKESILDSGKRMKAFVSTLAGYKSHLLPLHYAAKKGVDIGTADNLIGKYSLYTYYALKALSRYDSTVCTLPLLTAQLPIFGRFGSGYRIALPALLNGKRYEIAPDDLSDGEEMLLVEMLKAGL